MIVRVIEAEVCGEYRMRLSFSDGTKKVVDLEQLLNGPIFEPLKDPTYFAQGSLDQVCGTVVWPNGADIAPETLHDMLSVEEPAT